MADLFTERFGYRVTAGDLGLGGSPAVDRALTYSPPWDATVTTVMEPGRADVDRRMFLAGVPFTAVAGIGPSRDWLLSTLDQNPSRPGQRVRLEDVIAVRNMFGVFQKMDIFQGGGSGRRALTKYLNQHVFPLLKRTYTEDVRKALCEAASEQTYLAGWMAYDNGEHGTAQRFLIQSLRLAEESGNAALGAHVLAGMADQATLVGHPAEGRRLAQAGRHGLAKTMSNACLADLWTLEARALAVLGEPKAAAHAIHEAQTAYTKVDLADEPEWAAFIDPAYLGGEWANAFRDMSQPAHAEEHAKASIRHAERQKRARRGAMSQAVVAVSHLQRNDLDAAHAAGVRTLKLASQVKSSRCVEAVQDIQRRMVSFGKNPLVADFNERARSLVRAA
ncbi:transcriptional regulator [Streptomyces rimosus]|uniref:transcriptional regulator n=1 Tax=Streptomyces rimosus TaxID=1927 RepID=UPI00373FCA57